MPFFIYIYAGNFYHTPLPIMPINGLLVVLFQVLAVILIKFPVAFENQESIFVVVGGCRRTIVRFFHVFILFPKHRPSMPISSSLF